MFLTIAAVLALAVLAGQLLICFRCGEKWKRLILPVLLGAGAAVCLSLTAVEQFIRLPFGAAFAAYLYGLILLLLLAAAIAGWLIWAAVKTVQKCKKIKM